MQGCPGRRGACDAGGFGPPVAAHGPRSPRMRCTASRRCLACACSAVASRIAHDSVCALASAARRWV